MSPFHAKHNPPRGPIDSTSMPSKTSHLLRTFSMTYNKLSPRRRSFGDYVTSAYAEVFEFFVGSPNYGHSNIRFLLCLVACLLVAVDNTLLFSMVESSISLLDIFFPSSLINTPTSRSCSMVVWKCFPHVFPFLR